MTTPKAPVDQKRKTQDHEPETYTSGSAAFGFFHKYQKQIIYTAGIFTLVTFSITGAITGAFESWFRDAIPYPTMNVPGFGAVVVSEEDHAAAKGIRRVRGSRAPVFAFPRLGTGDAQSGYTPQLAALRALAVRAGVDASEDDVEAIIQAAIKTYKYVESVKDLATFAQTGDVTLFRQWVRETLRVGTFLRLSVLGVDHSENAVIDQLLEDHEQAGFKVAYLDSKAFKKELKEKASDDVLRKYLEELEDIKADKYRKPANRAAIKVAMLEDGAFDHSEYPTELGQEQIGDAEVQGRYLRDREVRYKLPPKKEPAKKGESPEKDGDGAKDKKPEDKDNPEKKGDGKEKEEDGEERGNGSTDPLARGPETSGQGEAIEQAGGQETKKPEAKQAETKKPDAQAPGAEGSDGVPPAADPDANPDAVPPAQDPDDAYKPLDEDLKKAIREQLYAEVVLSKWQAALDTQMATHMIDVINAATAAEIATEEAETKKAEADVELEGDADNAELKKKVEELEKKVEVAKAAAEKAADAVNSRRKAFDFEAAVKALGGGRKGLKIITVEMKDAQELRELESLGKWNDSHLPGSMSLAGEVYSGRVQSTEKGAFVFQVTDIEEKPFKKFEDIKEDLQAEYVTEKSDKNKKDKKDAFEKALERLARKKLADDVAKLEKEGAEKADKKFTDWKAAVDKAIHDAEERLSGLDKTTVAYGHFTKVRDAKKKELENADAKKKEFAKETETETDKEIDEKLREAHKDVLVAAGKEVGLVIEDIGPFSRKLQGTPRFKYRYSNIIQSIFGDPEVSIYDADDTSPLKEDTINEVVYMAVCNKVEKARPEQITRRQWLSLRNGAGAVSFGGGGSFAGTQMQKALDQSFTLEALKEGCDWKDPAESKQDRVSASGQDKKGGKVEKDTGQKNGEDAKKGQ